MAEQLTVAAPTITELFAQAIDKWSDDVAFRVKRGEDWVPITFGEYGEQVRACAGGLIAMGLAPGDFGSIISANRPEWHSSDLGMINAGLVSCPVYPTNSASQVHYILEHSESKVIFCENAAQLDKVLSIRKDLPDLRAAIVFTGENCDGEFAIAWDDLLERGREFLKLQPGEYDVRRTAAGPDSLLGVIYTSGTTGPPKGTMISHHNAVWTLASLDAVLEAGPGDRKLSFLPLSHVGERTSSEYLQIQQGFEIWFATSLETLGQDMVACKPTVQFVVPRILEKQYDGIMKLLGGLPDENRTKALQAIELGKQRVRLEQQGQSLPEEMEALYQQADGQLFAMARGALGYDQVKALVSGAAPIALDLLEFFNAIGVRTIEVYGQTEGHGPTTINRIDKFKLGTVGYAIPGAEVRLAEDGEILLRGGNVCLGYYKNDEATRELIDDEGWLHSGDIGVMDDEGFVTITDRKKDIIITSSGKNIAPQNHENELKSSKFDSQALVIGDKRPYCAALITLDEPELAKWAGARAIEGEHTLAALAQNEQVRELVQGIVDRVNSDHSRYEQLKKFTILPRDFTMDDGEVTPTLKLKRRVCQEHFASDIDALYA